MCCISFLQGHYPRMRMPTRCMPAVTFQAEIPSKKANPLWTACVKISFFFFLKKSNWCTCPLTQGPSYVPTLQTNQNLTTKRRAANAPQREQQWEFYSRVSILQDAELKHHFASTALNIFFFLISLATIHELQIKIMRFHWLSGFWRVQRVVKFRLPRSVEKDHLYMATTAQLTEVSTARYNPTTLQLGINT